MGSVPAPGTPRKPTAIDDANPTTPVKLTTPAKSTHALMGPDPADDSETEPEDDLPPPVPSRVLGVRSSNTPSPLKAPLGLGTPRNNLNDDTPKSSPLRPAVSEEIARKLQETLTVLGKRSSGDDGTVAAPGKERPGKRARPRLKVRPFHLSSCRTDIPDATVARSNTPSRRSHHPSPSCRPQRTLTRPSRSARRRARCRTRWACGPRTRTQRSGRSACG
jgi:hypothetical protein